MYPSWFRIIIQFIFSATMFRKDLKIYPPFQTAISWQIIFLDTFHTRATCFFARTLVSYSFSVNLQFVRSSPVSLSLQCVPSSPVFLSLQCVPSSPVSFRPWWMGPLAEMKRQAIESRRCSVCWRCNAAACAGDTATLQRVLEMPQRCSVCWRCRNAAACAGSAAIAAAILSSILSTCFESSAQYYFLHFNVKFKISVN